MATTMSMLTATTPPIDSITGHGERVRARATGMTTATMSAVGAAADSCFSTTAVTITTSTFCTTSMSSVVTNYHNDRKTLANRPLSSEKLVRTRSGNRGRAAEKLGPFSGLDSGDLP